MATTTTDDSLKENNQDLTLERSNASFNINEITEIIDGGVDKTKFRKEMGMKKGNPVIRTEIRFLNSPIFYPFVVVVYYKTHHMIITTSVLS